MKQEMSSVDVAALVRELHPRLLDAKITKIYQHSPDEIRIGTDVSQYDFDRIIEMHIQRGEDKKNSGCH